MIHETRVWNGGPGSCRCVRDPRDSPSLQSALLRYGEAITLQGTVLRVAWVNPHVLLYLQAANDKGELETWIIHGRSLNNALRQVGLKEHLQPGVFIAARVWPARNPLYVNDVETVWITRPGDARQSSRIVGGGESGSPMAMCSPMAEAPRSETVITPR